MDDLLDSLARDALGMVDFRTKFTSCIKCDVLSFAAASSLRIGQRVQLHNGQKGTIRHLGVCHWAPGDHVGVEMDNPVGDHDGTIENVTYFATKPGHGLFLKPRELIPIAGEDPGIQGFNYSVSSKKGPVGSMWSRSRQIQKMTSRSTLLRQQPRTPNRENPSSGALTPKRSVSTPSLTSPPLDKRSVRTIPAPQSLSEDLNHRSHLSNEKIEEELKYFQTVVSIPSEYSRNPSSYNEFSKKSVRFNEEEQVRIFTDTLEKRFAGDQVVVDADVYSIGKAISVISGVSSSPSAPSPLPLEEISITPMKVAQKDSDSHSDSVLLSTASDTTDHEKKSGNLGRLNVHEAIRKHRNASVSPTRLEKRSTTQVESDEEVPHPDFVETYLSHPQPRHSSSHIGYGYGRIAPVDRGNRTENETSTQILRYPSMSNSKVSTHAPAKKSGTDVIRRNIENVRSMSAKRTVLSNRSRISNLGNNSSATFVPHQSVSGNENTRGRSSNAPSLQPSGIRAYVKSTLHVQTGSDSNDIGRIDAIHSSIALSDSRASDGVGCAPGSRLEMAMQQTLPPDVESPRNKVSLSRSLSSLSHSKFSNFVQSVRETPSKSSVKLRATSLDSAGHVNRLAAMNLPREYENTQNHSQTSSPKMENEVGIRVRGSPVKYQFARGVGSWSLSKSFNPPLNIDSSLSEDVRVPVHDSSITVETDGKIDTVASPTHSQSLRAALNLHARPGIVLSSPSSSPSVAAPHSPLSPRSLLNRAASPSLSSPLKTESTPVEMKASVKPGNLVHSSAFMEAVEAQRTRSSINRTTPSSSSVTHSGGPVSPRSRMSSPSLLISDRKNNHNNNTKLIGPIESADASTKSTSLNSSLSVDQKSANLQEVKVENIPSGLPATAANAAAVANLTRQLMVSLSTVLGDRVPDIPFEAVHDAVDKALDGLFAGPREITGEEEFSVTSTFDAPNKSAENVEPPMKAEPVVQDNHAVLNDSDSLARSLNPSFEEAKESTLSRLSSTRLEEPTSSPTRGLKNERSLSLSPRRSPSKVILKKESISTQSGPFVSPHRRSTSPATLSPRPPLSVREQTMKASNTLSAAEFIKRARERARVASEEHRVRNAIKNVVPTPLAAPGGDSDTKTMPNTPNTSTIVEQLSISEATSTDTSRLSSNNGVKYTYSNSLDNHSSPGVIVPMLHLEKLKYEDVASEAIKVDSTSSNIISTSEPKMSEEFLGVEQSNEVDMASTTIGSSTSDAMADTSHSSLQSARYGISAPITVSKEQSVAIKESLPDSPVRVSTPSSLVNSNSSSNEANGSSQGPPENLKKGEASELNNGLNILEEFSTSSRISSPVRITIGSVRTVISPTKLEVETTSSRLQRKEIELESVPSSTAVIDSRLTSLNAGKKDTAAQGVRRRPPPPPPSKSVLKNSTNVPGTEISKSPKQSSKNMSEQTPPTPALHSTFTSLSSRGSIESVVDVEPIVMRTPAMVVPSILPASSEEISGSDRSIVSVDVISPDQHPSVESSDMKKEDPSTFPVDDNHQNNSIDSAAGAENPNSTLVTQEVVLGASIETEKASESVPLTSETVLSSLPLTPPFAPNGPSDVVEVPAEKKQEVSSELNNSLLQEQESTSTEVLLSSSKISDSESDLELKSADLPVTSEPLIQPVSGLTVRSFAGLCETGIDEDPTVEKICQDATLMVEDPATGTVLLGVFDGHGEFGHIVAHTFRDNIAALVFSSQRMQEMIMVEDNIPSFDTSKLRSKPSSSLSSSSPKLPSSLKTISTPHILSKQSQLPTHSKEQMEVLLSMAEEALQGEQQLFTTSSRAPVPESARLRRNVADAIKESLASVEEFIIGESGLDCSLSGTTAVVVAVCGRDVTVVNVGDSRAVLVRQTTQLSEVASQFTSSTSISTQNAVSRSSSPSSANIHTVLEAFSSSSRSSGSGAYATAGALLSAVSTLISPPLEHNSEADLLTQQTNSSEVVSAASSSKVFIEMSNLLAFPLTIDHKPELRSETRRILLRGGRIHAIKYADGAEGPMRVWLPTEDVPGLAMSRSLCDSLAKQAGCISTPDVFTYTLGEDDRYIVLASDGLWEFVAPSEAVSILAAAASRTELAVINAVSQRKELIQIGLTESAGDEDIEAFESALRDEALRIPLNVLLDESGKRWLEREHRRDDISIIVAEIGVL